MRYLPRACAALIIVSLALAPVASAKPHHRHLVDPMASLIKAHHWAADQATYEWDILARESGSSPGHLNLSAANGVCWGSGQLSDLPGIHIYGPVAVYHYFGGNYYTVRGQETADLNYIVQHGYGTPEVAWEHEEAFNWY